MPNNELPAIWPDGCRSAVSLTFDDGLTSHLSRAIPILDEVGLHGTFYLVMGGDDYLERMAPWRDVGAAGHELGNHTLHHYCYRNVGKGVIRGLQDVTLEEIDNDVSEGKRRVQELVPGQADTTFCYPCYNTDVGVGAERRSYVPIVARHHIAGRVFGELANAPVAVDLHHLSSFNVEDTGAPEMIGICESVAAGRWIILTFHGIDEGHLSISEHNFRLLIDHLHGNRDRIWVAPVAEVARRIVDWRVEHSFE